MLPDYSRAVVSALLQKQDADGTKIFIQTRWKPHINSPYSGLLEIPAGQIEPYENVYDTLKREIKEECGLDLVKIIDDFKSPVDQVVPGDVALAFKPFICQQVLKTRNGLPWIGFVFLCEIAETVTMQESEAKDPRWLTLNELDALITNQPETFFVLQLPVLKYYLSVVKK